jgi:pSer/pThr/pTyr-binding forkhead associated (FHA) protein
MDVRLLVAHAKADAKQIALGRETLIGRSPDCNLRIASGQVSRKHCVIKVADSLVTVRDLSSANGTRLNGQTIKTEVDLPIPPGSTLVVGPLKFIVQFSVPRLNEDTELLTRSASGDSSELQELQRMAAAPVADGEDTKDYPPSRNRKRGAAPPLVVKGEPVQSANAEIRDREAPPTQGKSTEADFAAIPNETVFDNFLDAGTGKAGLRVGPELLLDLGARERIFR